MTIRSARIACRGFAEVVIALALLVLGPAAVLAHASLVTSDPANGTTLAASPATITATFAEAFDASRSSMHLLGPDGTTLAANGPAAASTAVSMTISGFGTLAAGTYSVQWTTITPDDNGIERGTFSFTVGSATSGASAPPSGAPGAPATAAAPPGAGGGSASGGVGDVAIPLVVLAALLAVGLAWFLRRSR
jgi:methionine-rich copper-binding protein CopC